ncbi:ABC transporter permease [Corynebacterium otitidis]|uniref:ABC transporter permease n=1 Tax=Corynebacterium otitidis TaxID=29321 RepID=UPI000627C9A3|nr:ABC transporter permease [Corynebacterium otitidis]KKO84583.1 antibiotic transporter [Corynebacterium otitidis]
MNGLRTHIKVAVRSTPALANGSTAVTTLGLIPLIETVFLVAVATAVNSPETTMTAYAGLIVGAITATMGAGVGAVARDRALGVLAEVISFGPFNPKLWLARFLPAAAVTVASSAIGACGIYALDSTHDVERLVVALLAILAAVPVGVSAGMACAAAATVLRDPFAVVNVVAPLLPITAGVILPHEAYPPVFKELAALCPGTWLIDALRSAAVPGVGLAESAPALALEGLVCAGWLGVGLAAIGWAARRVYRTGDNRALL